MTVALLTIPLLHCEAKPKIKTVKWRRREESAKELLASFSNAELLLQEKFLPKPKGRSLPNTIFSLALHQDF